MCGCPVGQQQSEENIKQETFLMIHNVYHFKVYGCINYRDIYSTYKASSFYCQASQDGPQGTKVIQIGASFMLHLFTLDGLSFQD
jgi:hypothetical protein